MSNQHQERPGFGVMFYEPPAKRSSPKGPDYKGFILLEMDYKAGEKLYLSCWERQTSSGFTLMSLAESNAKKKQQENPTEVKTGYQRQKNEYAYRPRDEDVPF